MSGGMGCFGDRRVMYSAEFDPLAAVDLQAVGSASFLQKYFHISVAVDQGLGVSGEPSA